MTDQELMHEIINSNDHQSFAVLMQRYKQQVVGFAYKFVHDHDLALEVSQDSFVKVYKNRHDFNESLPFKPWLFKIVRNTALNINRFLLRRRTIALEPLHYQIADEYNNIESNTEYRQLLECISLLSVKLQEVLILKHFEGMNYSEIAHILDIPENTVASRLHLARKLLGEQYGM